MITFDLVGATHGREYTEHGEYVSAQSYWDLKLYSEAVDRLKLGLEQENSALRKALVDVRDAVQREYWDEYAGLDETRAILDAALGKGEPS